MEATREDSTVRRAGLSWSARLDIDVNEDATIFCVDSNVYVDILKGMMRLMVCCVFGDLAYARQSCLALGHQLSETLGCRRGDIVT